MTVMELMLREFLFFDKNILKIQLQMEVWKRFNTSKQRQNTKHNHFAITFLLLYIESYIIPYLVITYI